jgi:hypothetical protein
MSQPATVNEARPPGWGGFAPTDGDERQGQLRKDIAVCCGSTLALSMAKMNRTVTTCVVGALLLVAATVAAEPGIDISTTPAPPERGPLEASPPKDDRTHPSIGFFSGGPGVDSPQHASGQPAVGVEGGQRLGRVRSHVHLGRATASPVPRVRSPLKAPVRRAPMPRAGICIH